MPPNPSGLCLCGCGKPTPLAKRTWAPDQTVKGEPVRYLRGHQNFGARDLPPGFARCSLCSRPLPRAEFRLIGHASRNPETFRIGQCKHCRPACSRMRLDKAAPPHVLLNPSGICACGCGQLTALATHTHLERGYRKGDPLRYIRGHWSFTRPPLPDGYAHCPYCVKDMPIDAFTRPPTGDGKESRTRICRLCQRNRNLKYSYDLGPVDYERLNREQNGLCAICQKPEGSGAAGGRNRHPLVVDHDHRTGKVRALLCQRCNRALGLFSDNIEYVAAAAEYLRRFALD